MRAIADRRDETGATATEYSLLVGFIAMVLVAGVTAFGAGLSNAFIDMSTWVNTLASKL
ncbi:hypothetical protein Pve01_73210 [Planomonospora venezuelensis]|nr:hypothetical protein Pve01_73210 [Planomonospora venezuelensis]